MGIFESSCNKCGSKEHASENCPHGIFSSKCSHCGSVDHASSQCPHGIFSSKCSNCGSSEHSSANCPHGIFSSKCMKCGSKEHSSSQCPHGLFANKCNKCGSKNHSTNQCPQGKFTNIFGSSAGNSGMSGLITLVIFIFLMLALFSIPFKLIDTEFSSFDFKWFDYRDVWVFCLSAWLSALLIIYLLTKILNNTKGTLEDRFSNPYLSLSLFSISLSTFSVIYFSYRFQENYILLGLLSNLVCIGIIYLFVRFTARNKKIIIISISVLLMAMPYIYIGYYAEQFPISSRSVKQSNISEYITMTISSHSGANLRSAPSKTADIITKVPYSYNVNFMGDSAVENENVWYKIQFNQFEGWINKSLIKSQ